MFANDDSIHKLKMFHVIYSIFHTLRRRQFSTNRIRCIVSVCVSKINLKVSVELCIIFLIIMGIYGTSDFFKE